MKNIKEYVLKDNNKDWVSFTPSLMRVESNCWAGISENNIRSWQKIDVTTKHDMNFLNLILAMPHAGIFIILGIEESIKNVNSRKDKLFTSFEYFNNFFVTLYFFNLLKILKK